MNRMFTRIWALALLAFLPASIMFAQSPTKAKVQIRKNVNGQEEVFTEEFDLEEGQDIQDILRELDLLDEFGQLKDGQSFEISIKKMDVNGENQDVNLLFSPSDAEMNQAFFGVYLQNVTDEASEFQGAEVSSVIDGTKADEADMQAGDIIYKVDNTEVSSVSDLVEIIRDYNAGDKVKIFFYRDGKKEKVNTELGVREAEAPNRFFWDEDGDFGEEFGNRFEFEFPENEFIFSDSLMIAHFDCDKQMERVEQSFLGVTHGGNKTWEDGQPTGGMVVGSVVEGSSAQDMGLLTGDIIESFNGTPINTWSDLVKQIESSSPGDNVELEVLRDEQNISLSGPIGKREVCNGESFKIYHDMHGMDEEGNMFFNYDIDMEELEEGMKQLRIELEGLKGLQELEGLEQLKELERLEMLQGLEDVEYMLERNVEVIMGEGEDREVTVIVMDAEDGGEAVEREVTVAPLDDGQMKVIILDGEGSEEDVFIIAGEGMEEGEHEMEMERLIMEERRREREGAVAEEILIMIDIQAISDDEAAAINENADIQLRTSNDLSMESISFFPNPTQGQLNLNFEVTPVPDARLDIILYDQIGNIVYRESQTGFDGKYNGGIDISGEADGSYFLQILYGEQSFSRKVVKN